MHSERKWSANREHYFAKFRSLIFYAIPQDALNTPESQVIYIKYEIAINIFHGLISHKIYPGGYNYNFTFTARNINTFKMHTIDYVNLFYTFDVIV